MILARHHHQLEQRLQEARVLVATLLDERDLARKERDTAIARADALQDDVLRLEAHGIAADPNLWRAIADRAASEAEAYARQLRAAGHDPDRDYGRPDIEVSPGW